MVESWPLALCDSRSVDPRDLVATDTIRRHYISETFYSLFNADQKWYYLSQQSPEEVTMLKIYDSDKDAAVRCKPPPEHYLLAPLLCSNWYGHKSISIHPLPCKT